MHLTSFSVEVKIHYTPFSANFQLYLHIFLWYMLSLEKAFFHSGLRVSVLFRRYTGTSKTTETRKDSEKTAPIPVPPSFRLLYSDGVFRKHISNANKLSPLLLSS